MQNRPFVENWHSAYLSWQNLWRRLPPEKPRHQLDSVSLRNNLPKLHRRRTQSLANWHSDPEILIQLRRARLLPRERARRHGWVLIVTKTVAGAFAEQFVAQKERYR
jgi:hypothetical protein